MDEYIGEVAAPLIENRTMNMLFQKKKIGLFFGDGRFTAENWIGSHPSAIPCDLAAVSYIRYWQQRRDRNDTKFEFALAPRQNLQYMMDTGDPRVPPFILKRRNLRIRDYHLLGGMITRWLKFYQQIPDPSSWVWSYYEDADLWQKAVAQHGEKAFEKVAATVPAIGRKQNWKARAQAIAVIARKRDRESTLS
jgi:hypothetical protein